MAKNEIEIIPPSRVQRAAEPGAGRELSVNVARENPGGIISSALTRWEAGRHERVYGALASRTRAEAKYFDAQCEAVDAYIRRAQAGQHLAELPEVLANDRARRRAARAEELREIEHQYQLAAYRRAVESARVQTELVDAEQALRAQREFGYLTHELAWRKRNTELLDIELDAAERRAMLREAQNPSQKEPTEDELIQQLLSKREQLRADGVDTGPIDAALARVQKR
ncbi:MAG TPA: hypothetical protein VFB45_04610 [Pseudolabrys sp.]|nr:hypothetical protein [Pseudolabrys sp.]